MKTIEPLQRAWHELVTGRVWQTIVEMETYLAAYPQQHTYERLQAIKNDYGLMADYWCRGFQDPQLSDLYRQLLQRLYVLFANVNVYQRMRNTVMLATSHHRVRQPGRDWAVNDIRASLENFVSETAMLQLEPENKRKEKSAQLFKAHQQQMNDLFDYILTSRMWTENVATAFEEMLLSPTIDAIDQQLIVSVVMLSALYQFDIAKFRLLIHVYSRSTDEQVRQRALVGWALVATDELQAVYPEQRQLIEDLLHSEQAVDELTELQIQLIYCLNAERDTQKIQKEIMPDLLKNNNFRFTNNGIEEVDDDPMEDVLRPDASEQRMEKLEQSFQQMMDMQKQGSDIYFGGFSQMKRFPFFYDTSNWFVPFYPQHPDIQSAMDGMSGNKFIEQMVKTGPFCNSDKYSFVIAFQQVMERMPLNMRQMLSRGEATVGGVPSEELNSPAYIRRSYLQDLYRFFRLNPNRKELANPFDTTNNELGTCLFFMLNVLGNTPITQRKNEVVGLLMKQQLQHSAQLLLNTYSDAMKDVRYYMWTSDYERVLKLEPHHKRALSGYARELFSEGRFAGALVHYDTLLSLLTASDDGKNAVQVARVELNKAICLVYLKRYEEALHLLYRLEYESDGRPVVKRVLAWAQMCCGKQEQALKNYEQLVSADVVATDDRLNYGYCLWLSGNVKKAVEQFKIYLEASQKSELNMADDEKELLRSRGISETEMLMMQGLVSM